MKNFVKTTFILSLLLVLSNVLLAQNSTTKSIKERYIEINDISNLFVFSNDNNSDLISFELYNIYENESSKPLFVSVNEIPNVKKFNLKTDSDQFENQRTCYLSINKINYMHTFRQVLKAMDVKYIKHNDIFIEIDEYFSQIK
jgi:hypothetical protein